MDKGGEWSSIICYVRHTESQKKSSEWHYGMTKKAYTIASKPSGNSLTKSGNVSWSQSSIAASSLVFWRCEALTAMLCSISGIALSVEDAEMWSCSNHRIPTKISRDDSVLVGFTGRRHSWPQCCDAEPNDADPSTWSMQFSGNNTTRN